MSEGAAGPVVNGKPVTPSPDGASVDLKTPTKSDPNRVSVQSIDPISGQPQKVSEAVLKTLPKEGELEFSKPRVVVDSKTPVGAAKGEWIPGGKSATVSAQFIIPSDGDTFRAKDPKNPTEAFLCRFSGSDAPETKHGNKPGQPYGEQSLANFQKLVANKEVKVTVKEARDSYGRLICDISVEGKDVQLEQIKGGFAWAFDQYASPEVKEAYKAAQRQAAAQKLGLWSDPNPVKPGDWRHKIWPMYK